jgi:hypothetical protein
MICYGLQGTTRRHAGQLLHVSKVNVVWRERVVLGESLGEDDAREVRANQRKGHRDRDRPGHLSSRDTSQANNAGRYNNQQPGCQGRGPRHKVTNTIDPGVL